MRYFERIRSDPTLAELRETPQFLLGHVSVQTTEKYLGCEQRFQGAVNDHLGIEPLVS